MARYLQSKGASLTVIIVGGAVNTLFLQSRGTTHDIDFFNNNLKKEHMDLILAAARYAREQDSNLPSQWLNNRTVLFIRADLRNTLTNEAYQQNEVVFEQRGLRVLAAPWNYAFCAKLDRLTGATDLGESRPYDVSDAAAYLHRYLSIHRINTLTDGEVRAWANRFGTAVNSNVIRRVNEEFFSKIQLGPDYSLTLFFSPLVTMTVVPRQATDVSEYKFIFHSHIK